MYLNLLIQQLAGHTIPIRNKHTNTSVHFLPVRS